MTEHNVLLKLGVTIEAKDLVAAVKRAREIEKAFACLLELSPGVRVIDKIVKEN